MCIVGYFAALGCPSYKINTITLLVFYHQIMKSHLLETHKKCGKEFYHNSSNLTRMPSTTFC